MTKQQERDKAIDEMFEEMRRGEEIVFCDEEFKNYKIAEVIA